MSAHGQDEETVDDQDAAHLRALGYGQELARRMSGFSNFAISLSIICILAGGVTSLQLGVSAVGGAAAGIVWPLGLAFSCLAAVAMATVASAYPTAGGLYHWSSLLGGRGWGWATAWFNLTGLLFVTAAVNVGTLQLFMDFVVPAWATEARSSSFVQPLGVLLLTASQATFNHWGIRITTRLTDFSGYLILAVAAALTLSLLVHAPTLEWSRLVTVVNLTGEAGGGVWPAQPGTLRPLLLGLMWPLYTITGFDASAHTAEETHQAARNVPRGILRSVLVSGFVGWAMVGSFVLAMPDVGSAAAQGAGVFAWLLEQVVPDGERRLLWGGIVLANYLCGLACVTSTSRMVFAFARDGGLPGSGWLRRVSPSRRTPAVAIWVSAAFTVLSTLYAPAYTTLSSACVIFLYVSYVMPNAAGILALGRTWTTVGPFFPGATLFRLIAGISVAGTAVVVWIGVQPPNERALSVLGVLSIALVVAWISGVRRTFVGPPLPAR